MSEITVFKRGRVQERRFVSGRDCDECFLFLEGIESAPFEQFPDEWQAFGIDLEAEHVNAQIVVIDDAVATAVDEVMMSVDVSAEGHWTDRFPKRRSRFPAARIAGGAVGGDGVAR